MGPQVGVRYKVTMSDCCIEGEFVATCTAFVETDEDAFMTFDNGVVLTNWMQATFEVVD
jgi:hypothetical protein